MGQSAARTPTAAVRRSRPAPALQTLRASQDPQATGGKPGSRRTCLRQQSSCPPREGRTQATKGPFEGGIINILRDRKTAAAVNQDACVLRRLGRVQLVPLWGTARQAPLSVGILQAGILEWAAMHSYRGSFQLRDQIQVSCISCTGKRLFTTSTTWEAPNQGKRRIELSYFNLSMNFITDLFKTKMQHKNMIEMDWLTTWQESVQQNVRWVPWHKTYKTASNCEISFLPREGNGTPLQYFCLGNPMDGGAW